MRFAPTLTMNVIMDCPVLRGLQEASVNVLMKPSHTLIAAPILVLRVSGLS